MQRGDEACSLSVSRVTAEADRLDEWSLVVFPEGGAEAERRRQLRG